MSECCPECWGKECGHDGCGGSCGSCTAGRLCLAGQCYICEPDCAGKECGDDGCGGLCGECPEGFFCADWRCEEGECDPVCEGKECGYDDCGGLCGECGEGTVCVAGQCQGDEGLEAPVGGKTRDVVIGGRLLRLGDPHECR